MKLFEMKTRAAEKMEEPKTPEVQPDPNKPQKKEGDNDFTREKPNDPTHVPTPHPGEPVKQPEKPTVPTPKN